MSPTRRTVLKGLGGVAAAGVAVPAMQSNSVPGIGTALGTVVNDHLMDGPGTAITLGFSDAQSWEGFSDEVYIQAVNDPATPGNGESGRQDVVHINSIPDAHQSDKGNGKSQGKGKGNEDKDDENGDDGSEHAEPIETVDYGLTLVDVSNQELTIEDVADLEGDDAFAYDWYVTDNDTVGVGTDHQMSGVGPDEVWFVMEIPEERDDTKEGDNVVSDLPEIAFRTMYSDEGTFEWNTRTVSDELTESSDPPWREVSIPEQRFVDLDTDLVDKYGDAEVRAVGVGRGDPYFGPSILDTYYSNLRLNGRQYSLPVSVSANEANDSGNGKDD